MLTFTIQDDRATRAEEVARCQAFQQHRLAGSALSDPQHQDAAPDLYYNGFAE